MEATLTRKAWVKPTRKLTDEEIQELVENFDYDTYLADFDEDADPEPSYDIYGNPSRDTLAWLYEREHNISYPFSWDELDEILEETETCGSLDSADSLRAI